MADFSGPDPFARCFAFTIAAEGGFSDMPADPGNWTGGAIGHGELHGTNFGLSAASYPTLDLKNLTEAQAAQIYRRDFFVPLQADRLAPPLALVAFDSAVNAGLRRAVIWLQQAAGLAADGIMGPATLAALAKADSFSLAQEVLVRRLEFLIRLPSWPHFGRGWARRVIRLAGEVAKTPPA